MYTEATHCKECGRSSIDHCSCKACYFFECTCEFLQVKVGISLPIFDSTSMYVSHNGLTGQIALDRDTFFKALDTDSADWLKEAQKRRKKVENARKAKERREAKKLLKEFNI